MLIDFGVRDVGELPVAILQPFLDRCLKEHGGRIDYIHGEETAVALGVPLGTAKFRLARARALLRAALEPLFGKEPR